MDGKWCPSKVSSVVRFIGFWTVYDWPIYLCRVLHFTQKFCELTFGQISQLQNIILKNWEHNAENPALIWPMVGEIFEGKWVRRIIEKSVVLRTSLCFSSKLEHWPTSNGPCVRQTAKTLCVSQCTLQCRAVYIPLTTLHLGRDIMVYKKL